MSSTDISRMDVPATVQPEGQAIALPSDVSQAITQMAQIMQGMANMVRATNERMGMLEQQVRLLTKVTPAQASAISAAIRDRAKKYFPSTPHANAKAIIRKTIDSPELVAIFCAVIASFGEDWWRQRAAALGAGDQAATQAAKAITDALVEREYLPIRPAGKREAIRRRCDRQIVAAVDVLHELTPQARAQLLTEAQAGEARGIGLGSQLSQLVQLAQLSAIDHYAKEERRVPVYQRYMDDSNAMDESRERLTETVDGIVERLHVLGLELNPKSQMIPLRNGFTFLKWHFILTPTGKVILRAAHGVAAEEKRRLRRMMKQVHAGKASLESVQAHYRGWRAHMEIGNTCELLRGMDKYFAALIAAENKESEGEP